MEILKLVYDYLIQHHPELQQTLPELETFTFRPYKKRLEGYTRANFTAGKWEIIIGHAVIPQIVYNVTADYNKGEITWSGQVTEEHVEEKSYVISPQKTS